MARKYDAEDLLDTVLGIMQTDNALNNKIAAIESEKATAGKTLGTALKTISKDNYYLQSWNEKILQNTPGIFYGVEDVQVNSNGPVVAKTYKIFVEVVLIDSGMTSDGSKRIYRYARALEEVFAAAFAQAAGYTVKIESVRPMAFKLAVDSDEEVKVGGISLQINLA